MTRRLQLSELTAIIQETVEDRFLGDSFWINAEITDVKKYDSKRWCFLKFIEKRGSQIATEMQAVFWANGYQQIVQFEKVTQQSFKDGLEISCRVEVKFHPRFGLKLEVVEIDTSFALGKLEMERQQTLDKLLKENAGIHLFDGDYDTPNKRLKLPSVVQRIALITAPNSDGQRDFIQELTHNVYGYHFKITEFLTQLQGDTAVDGMLTQLQNIYYQSPDFDAVVIVRGGGSQTDFKPFDSYSLARQVALFPLPIFTGIGHDRNTSITDLMARQLKTPTKVAAALIDINFRFENELQQLALQMEDAVEELILDKQLQINRWTEKLALLLPQKIASKKIKLTDWKHSIAQNTNRTVNAKFSQLQLTRERLEKSTNHILVIKNNQLLATTRLLHQLSPQTIINRGFAMVMSGNKIIIGAADLKLNEKIETIFKNGTVVSTINKITEHEENDF